MTAAPTEVAATVGNLTAFPWQMSQWEQLGNLRAAGRLPHALLLGGVDGIGKLRFARAFAAVLLCESPDAFSACGQCRACTLLGAGNHPDFQEVSPLEGKRQIGVDQIRGLQGFVAQRAHREGGRKLVLIHPAESMNLFTANALLKTLEEPAGDTVILLVSHAVSLLLPTIRSRCLALKFGVPPRAAALDWLRHHLGNEEQARMLLAEVGGRPLAAKRHFDDDGVARWRRFDHVLGDTIRASATPLQLADVLSGEETIDGLEWWLGRAMMLMRHRLGGATAPPPPWTEIAYRTPRWLMERIDTLIETRAKIQRGATPSKRLLWEDIALSWFSE